MNTHEENDWFMRLLVPMGYGTQARKKPSRSPATPVRMWQRAFAKARRVKQSARGSSKAATTAHTRYLLHKNSREHEDKLIAEIGNIKSILKTFDNEQPHYRVIIAPQRGDVLDMERLAKNVTKEVMERFGEFDYAGAIHEKLQSNGRMNKHIHLIFKAPFDVGARALKCAFSTAAAREATLQFEDMGLKYVPDPLDLINKIEAKHFNNELIVGDHV